MTDSRVRAGNTVVEGEVVKLDYSRFEKKSFVGCTLVYGGGFPPILIDVDFIDSSFALEGPAQQTASFLSMLANSNADAKKMILDMLGLHQ